MLKEKSGELFKNRTVPNGAAASKAHMTVSQQLHDLQINLKLRSQLEQILFTPKKKESGRQHREHQPHQAAVKDALMVDTRLGQDH